MQKVYYIKNMQVIIVGRVLNRVYREPGQMHYIIHDNSGVITVIDYKGEAPDFLKNEEY